MTRKYLVVDDNLEFAENVAEILTSTGAEVSLAAEGISALEYVKHTRFDGVVTDMSMPGISGTEFLRQMRQVDPGVPVVLLSAFLQQAQVEEAQQWGLLACFNKVDDTLRLIQTLAQARRNAVVLVSRPALSPFILEALVSRGFTVCPLDSQLEHHDVPIKPIAVLCKAESPETLEPAFVDRVHLLFPDVPLLVLHSESPARAHSDAVSVVAQLEALTARELM